MWADLENGPPTFTISKAILLIERVRLQNVIIDLEVSASTPSPTIDPSVRTVLIGHSMGGIVAAEAILSITSDAPIPVATVPSTASRTPMTSASEEALPPSCFMFPYIQGILAFDTPYLGISPSVIAHGAETHYKSASTAYSTLTEVASVFGYGAASNSTPSSPSPNKQPKAILPNPDSAKDAMSASMAAKNADAAATPAWQRWGKLAMFAGAAGAVVAGGAAAYLKRDTITEGWSWVGSHLEFVGCLMRGEELRSRFDGVIQLQDEKAVGFKNLVTVLGKGAQGRVVANGYLENVSSADAQRTFCTEPKSERSKKIFERVVIEKAPDEIQAHMNMFYPRENTRYYNMSERAKELVTEWVEASWYESSEQGVYEGEEEGFGGEELVMVE